MKTYSILYSSTLRKRTLKVEYQVLLIDFHVYHRTKIQYGFVPMSKMPQFLNASSSFFLRDEPHTQCMRD